MKGKSEINEAIASIMESQNRYLREEFEANRRPFLYTMVMGIQVLAVYVGIIAAIVALFDVFGALFMMLGSTSFWVAVICGAIYVAGEWARSRLPVTEREKHQRKSSSSN